MQNKADAGGPSILIRVGKSGGTTCKKAIETSEIVFDEHFHTRQPFVRPNARYVIIARTPIARAISAFNWRHHLLIGAQKQLNRFPGEAAILNNFKTLNALAEALYDEDGRSKAVTQGNFRSIHHLGESISFHVSDVLDQVSPDQISGVIMQNSLVEDMQRVLGIAPVMNGKVMRHKTPADMLHLSPRAVRNLRKMMQDDFDCLRRLQSWGKLNPRAIEALDREQFGPEHDWRIE